MSSAQPYGNEWIDYNQQYYKFPISSEGVYRINQSTLINAGIPLSSIDPRNIQLFARGTEVSIYIEGESDGTFDPNDYIEFYAQGNDGFADEKFYNDPADHSNPYYSLINDTIHYFLTWNNATNNKRFAAENDVNFIAYAASNYVWRETVLSFSSNYYLGKTYSGGGGDPMYEPTEGWFDFYFSLGGGRTRSIETSLPFYGGPDSEVSWKIIGLSDFASVTPDQHLSAVFAGNTFDTIFEGYEPITKKFTIATAGLGSGTSPFSFFSINDLGSGVGRMAIAYIKVKYPHVLNFGNRTQHKIIVPNHQTQNKTYLPFSAFTSNGSTWLYDLTNSKRIKVSSSGSTHQVLIPNAVSEKECFVFSEGNTNVISSLKAVGSNARFINFLNQEETNAFIIIGHASFKSEIAQYEAYRNSTGHNAIAVDVQELYHQFIYGINKHPLSIRNFIDFISDNWATTPKNIFLVGKSVKASQSRKTPSNYQKNLIPTFGEPASDILFTSGLNGTILEPLVPTGRLSAQNTSHVQLYLDKVMEYESNAPAPWMKNVLHFAGGTSSTESVRFSGYLKQFEEILNDTLFGSKVYTFKKSTTNPIQISLSDSIKGLINGGSSIMTFFGHASSTGGFDQNIDDPLVYNNKGKYPLLVGNSCFTGDIHEAQGRSTSENWVLIEDKGVIAFLASVDLGLESYLRDYSRNFFSSLGQYNYGGSLGQHMKFAIEKVQTASTAFPTRSVALLMTLHGDPAVVINSFEMADYVITSSDVSTNPSPITTKNDTFELILNVFNHGRAVSEYLDIEIIRVLPDLSTELYKTQTKPIGYERRVVLKIPLDPKTGSGFNRFDISLDPSNLIPEINESNNFVSVNHFIRSGDLIPVMPFEFAIVPEQSPILKASTGYAFESLQEYILELDTNDAFVNPIEKTTITSIGGVVKWSPSSLINMKDSMVYFWRARNNGGISSIWRHSSFQFIPNKRGWSQAHFDQIIKNDLLHLYINNSKNSLEFGASIKKLQCQTTSTGNLSDLGDILYKIDSDLKEYGGCGLGSAIHIAVLDSLSFEPWGTPYQGQNANHNFGQLNINGNCGKPRVQNFFIFNSNNASQLAGLKDMLVNKVPDGNYILAWTWIRNDFSSWDVIDPAMRSVFTNLGANLISSISNDSMPYIFFVKKGDQSTAIEELGTKYDEFIYLRADLQNSATNGLISTKHIGPASSWDSINWRSYSFDDPTGDEVLLKYYGSKQNEITGDKLGEFDESEKRNDISSQVSPIEYPYLDMTVDIRDKTLQTAAQMDKWTVLYEGVTDLAINASLHYKFHDDTIQEGDNLTLSVAVENISDYGSDSIIIDFYIIDGQRRRIDIPYKKQKPLSADSIFISEISYNTLGLGGYNTLIIDVNPGMVQPEQTLINNIGQIPFYVDKDNINPILDVTFDGLHILDGDIVSPEPEIIIQLTDENQFLILDDTSDFEIYMTDPSGNEKRKYFVNTDQSYSMDFISAQEGKNKAKVLYNPVMITDGKYVLRVKTKDRSNNVSGESQYAISYEVINRSTITNLMNYPNPFSTSTRFVFVLTGSKVPDNMQIQIMTISGKMIKTIYMYELGPINIGRNITDYAWDGKDEYGDKLANGVYLYRVTTRLNGSEIEHRSTSADYYFKKGFGKMVILR